MDMSEIKSRLKSDLQLTLQRFCDEHDLQSICIAAVEFPDPTCDTTTAAVKISADIALAGRPARRLTILGGTRSDYELEFHA